MIVDMPSTTTNDISKRLIALREQHGSAAGRVLTMLVVVEDENSEEAIESANHASHEHPCRIIVFIHGTSRGSARLDAQIRVGGDAGASEVIILRAFGPLTGHLVSVVIPLLLPDTPIVAWWPNEAPAVPADDPIGALANRRITDSAQCKRPANALQDRMEGYRPGDTDLAWTRLTLWRALLAATLDNPPAGKVTSARVVGATESPSTDLLAGWLALTLRCPVTRSKASGAEGLVSVRLEFESGPIIISRPDDELATLTIPGQVDRSVALPRRSVGDCLAEELRRLDPDEVYGEVLAEGLTRQRETGKVTRTKVPR